mmetsp:Transcript_7106/g.16741  ORF Transcript_7106/g.16741 Transcript_7106/m.16741 type:complete len:232 (-) Transcript_7106:1486-2181(-)
MRGNGASGSSLRQQSGSAPSSPNIAQTRQASDWYPGVHPQVFPFLTARRNHESDSNTGSPSSGFASLMLAGHERSAHGQSAVHVRSTRSQYRPPQSPGPMHRVPSGHTPTALYRQGYVRFDAVWKQLPFPSGNSVPYALSSQLASPPGRWRPAEHVQCGAVSKWNESVRKWSESTSTLRGMSQSCSMSPFFAFIRTHLCPVTTPSSVHPSPLMFITTATEKWAPAAMSSTL